MIIIVLKAELHDCFLAVLKLLEQAPYYNNIKTDTHFKHDFLPQRIEP